MRTVVLLLLIAGAALIVHGVYEEKLKLARQDVRVEYRFIPRTLYEEQMETTDLLDKYKDMFHRSAPWSAALGDPDSGHPATTQGAGSNP